MERFATKVICNFKILKRLIRDKRDMVIKLLNQLDGIFKGTIST